MQNGTDHNLEKLATLLKESDQSLNGLLIGLPLTNIALVKNSSRRTG